MELNRNTAPSTFTPFTPQPCHLDLEAEPRTALIQRAGDVESVRGHPCDPALVFHEGRKSEEGFPNTFKGGGAHEQELGQNQDGGMGRLP